MLRLDNLRSGGALRWKVEDHRLGRPENEMWKADTSKVVAPFVSVKNQWVSPREQVSNIPITCQRYGPGKPSSQALTEGWLCPHCFNGYLRGQTGYGPTDRSVGMLWIVLGALFLGSSGPAQLCWRQHERMLCIDRVRYVFSGTIRELSEGCVWHVGQVSAVGCTSIWITVTLGYE
jgi:hypothetical protein